MPALVDELVDKLTRPAELLIVEDDSAVGDTMARTLRRHFNCKAVVALDGATALKRLGERRFDLVLLDLIMPGKTTSIDVLKHIKNMPVYTPVVLVTGWPGSVQALEAARIGAVGLVVKPFQPSDFEEVFKLFKIRACRSTLVSC